MKGGDFLLEHPSASDLRQINPTTCAFLGDGVYELLVREEMIRRHTSLSAGKLHNFTVEMVCAKAQAKAFETIESLLTEEECAAYRRGRNTTSVAPPRHTEAADYRTATGLEALFGWLYLSGQTERIRALFDAILRAEKPNGNEAGEER